MPMANVGGLGNLGVQVPRGEEQLGAQDQLDGAADVQLIATDQFCQLRDGLVVGDAFAEERLTEPPGQPVRRSPAGP